MERAQVDAMESERAFMVAANGLDSVDDLQDSQGFGTLGQHESTVQAALGNDQTCPSKALHDFGKIAGWDLRLFRNFAGCSGGLLIGEIDDGSQRIFGSLRNHSVTILKLRPHGKFERMDPSGMSPRSNRFSHHTRIPKSPQIHCVRPCPIRHPAYKNVPANALVYEKAGKGGGAIGSGMANLPNRRRL